jgi:hypothetical protein
VKVYQTKRAAIMPFTLFVGMLAKKTEACGRPGLLADGMTPVMPIKPTSRPSLCKRPLRLFQRNLDDAQLPQLRLQRSPRPAHWMGTVEAVLPHLGGWRPNYNCNDQIRGPGAWRW